VLVDIVIRVPHTLDLLSIFVGNLDAKLFFKTHHEFDRVQRVGAEVVNESRVWRDFVLIDTKLIDDYLFNLVLDLLIGHLVCSSVSLFRPTQSTPQVPLSLLPDLLRLPRSAS
jgi:hypothetical protein